MTRPFVTIAVCTRDRAADLDRCLASLVGAGGVPHEVLVVDNGSTDATPEVLARWRSRLPTLRTVVEPLAGLSRARNRALDEAAGAVTAFLDDDATVRPGWLPAMAAAFEDPDVVGAAGRILLDWGEAGPPWWFTHRMDPWFTHLDLPVPAGDLPPGMTPWGANMAVRTAQARRVGGFDPRLGRRGRSLLSFEEQDFYQRLSDRVGGRLVWVPGAVVDHHVDPGRRSLRWVARRTLLNGRSRVLAAELAGGGPTGRAGHLAAAARAFVRAADPRRGRGQVHDAPRAARVVTDLVDRLQPLGAAVEHLRLSTSRGGP